MIFKQFSGDATAIGFRLLVAERPNENSPVIYHWDVEPHDRNQKSRQGRLNFRSEVQPSLWDL